jgi:hypothetical protein
MTQSNKFCKDLLGLCFTSPDEHRDQYFHAYSFNHDILNNMINNVNDDEKDFYSIKKIKVFKYISIKPTKKTDKYFLLDGKNISGLFMQLDDDHDKHDETGLYPIYGYNYLKNGLCEQVLLYTNVITEKMNSDGISSVPIKIDTFYEESILNA